MTRASRSRLVVFFLLPLLLLAQGVRVCLHDFDSAAHGVEHQHSTPLHLEGTLSGLSDHEKLPSDVDVPFSALIKLCAASLAFALIATFVFIMPVLSRHGLLLSSGNSRTPDSPALYYLRPPLRAPPQLS